jgi:plasmid stabilization system protein ParE
MRFTVRVMPRALADADEAMLWMSERSFERALNWHQGLFEAIQTLEHLPARCGLAPERQALGIALRQLLYRGYKVLFVIEGHYVRVLAIRHGHRRAVRRAEIEPLDN